MFYGWFNQYFTQFRIYKVYLNGIILKEIAYICKRVKMFANSFANFIHQHRLLHRFRVLVTMISFNVILVSMSRYFS
jgi:hypothetical protein